MIKISRLTDYAIVLLSHMAGARDRFVSASGLAEQARLPEPTVSKILKILARQKLIVSERGAGGGYRMERPAGQIRVTDVIEAMEGPISLTDCVDGSGAGCAAAHAGCAMKGRWDLVNETLKSALEAVTLEDMMAPRQGGRIGGLPAPAGGKDHREGKEEARA